MHLKIAHGQGAALRGRAGGCAGPGVYGLEGMPGVASRAPCLPPRRQPFALPLPSANPGKAAATSSLRMQPLGYAATCLALEVAIPPATTRRPKTSRQATEKPAGTEH